MADEVEELKQEVARLRYDLDRHTLDYIRSKSPSVHLQLTSNNTVDEELRQLRHHNLQLQRELRDTKKKCNNLEGAKGGQERTGRIAIAPNNTEWDTYMLKSSAIYETEEKCAEHSGAKFNPDSVIVQIRWAEKEQGLCQCGTNPYPPDNHCVMIRYNKTYCMKCGLETKGKKNDG